MRKATAAAMKTAEIQTKKYEVIISLFTTNKWVILTQTYQNLVTGNSPTLGLEAPVIDVQGLVWARVVEIYRCRS